MGSSGSKEALTDPPSTVQQAAAAADANEASSSSRCPVPEGYRNPAIYNVYGQRINDPASPACPSPLAALQGSDLLDPKNNMPLEANQQPCPGQRKPLSTERMQSNIPKGGTDTTWLYPSPQMFFNGARVARRLAAAGRRLAAAKRRRRQQLSAGACKWRTSLNAIGSAAWLCCCSQRCGARARAAT